MSELLSPSQRAEIERVVAGLSEAQRETIVCAWPYPDFHRSGEQISYCPVPRNASSGRALDGKRLTSSQADGGPRLTPLGLAVRQHLLEQSQERGGSNGR